MSRDAVRQAEELLTQTIARVLAKAAPRTEGEFLEMDVVQEIAKYPPELQQLVGAVLGKWLLSYNEDKVNWALDLISDLEATEHIPTLKRLRWKILFGLAPVRRDCISSLDGVLEHLQEKISQ